MCRRLRRSVEKRRKEKRRAALKIKLKKECIRQEFHDFRFCSNKILEFLFWSWKQSFQFCIDNKNYDLSLKLFCSINRTNILWRSGRSSHILFLFYFLLPFFFSFFSFYVLFSFLFSFLLFSRLFTFFIYSIQFLFSITLHHVCSGELRWAVRDSVNVDPKKRSTYTKNVHEENIIKKQNII